MAYQIRIDIKQVIDEIPFNPLKGCFHLIDIDNSLLYRLPDLCKIEPKLSSEIVNRVNLFIEECKLRIIYDSNSVEASKEIRESKFFNPLIDSCAKVLFGDLLKELRSVSSKYDDYSINYKGFNNETFLLK